MNQLHAVWIAILAFFLAFVPAACSCTESGSQARSGADATRAEVCGTVLDRATGAPVEGARVTFPGGRSERSDGAGRFCADDLDPGLAGEVVARAEDGREGRVTLRPLKAGRLEVVLSVGR